MAAPREPPWTLHEKNALLAEIIKVNAPPTHVLLNVINSMNMSPRLDEIPLPFGRSFNSSRLAFEAIRRESPMTMTPGPMGAQSSPMSAPLTGGKRTFPFEAAPPVHPGRQLAPKPMSGGPFGQPLSQIDQPPKKKRGRPTKAEAQAKAEAQGIAGESSSAARPSVAVAPMATPLAVQPAAPTPPTQMPVEERRPSVPQVSRMNISSMLAVTPTGPGSGSHSSSSSGKRRRGRSTRSEPGDVPSAGTAGGVEPFPEYESPYPRMSGEGVDSPARAAMLRRREERVIEEQQRPGRQQPPPGYGPAQQQHYSQPPQQQPHSSPQ